MSAYENRNVATQEAPGRWRLLVTGQANGAWNMAADEVLLEGVIAGAPPVLRLYAWNPPAVSLGYFQQLDDGIDCAEIQRRGFGIVRRPTGGRAILHKDEVTYCVCVPENAIRRGNSLMGSYRTISRGIEAGLRLLGIGAELAEHSGLAREQRKDTLPTVCFGQPARVDMVAAGRKIVGSAQTRRKQSILQHGSIPVHMDVSEHLAVMPGGLKTVADPDKAGDMFGQLACGIGDIIGRTPSFEEIVGALVAGFADALGVALMPDEISECEADAIDALMLAKYADDQWTARAPKRS